MTRRTSEDALLRTAVDVVVERGLASTRAADVAKAAGVSQALVFYHFASLDGLLAQAFTYAAEQDIARLEGVLDASIPPKDKLSRLIKLLAPSGKSKSWMLWIDGWSEALRSPEFEKVSRRLDLRWKEALSEVITAGVQDGSFVCDDPLGAAWRINCLVDGLAVQLTVHPGAITRKVAMEWIRQTAAREVGLNTEDLSTTRS